MTQPTVSELEAENRELREKLTKFEEDGAKGKGYSGSSGMVHRIDVLKQQLRAMTADRNLWQDEHNGDCPNLAALTAANARIAELEAQVKRDAMHRENGVNCEREDCSRALLALASAHICTPAEGYGSNSSWAISDLCRAVSELTAQVQELQWKPITPESVPKVGDELLGKHEQLMKMPEGYAPIIPMIEDFTFAGWTHYRPITPPAPSRAASTDGDSN